MYGSGRKVLYSGVICEFHNLYGTDALSRSLIVNQPDIDDSNIDSKVTLD